MSESQQHPLSIRDAARLLKRSTKSLRNYVKAGRLNAEKVPGPKGPQFVFLRSDVDRLAEELRLDVSGGTVHETVGKRPAHRTPSVAMLPTNLASSPAALIDAFLTAERERTTLLEKLSDAQAKANHTIGTLEERVTQLQARLKREERIVEQAQELRRELETLRKKVSERELALAHLRAGGERHWWQFWRSSQ